MKPVLIIFLDGVGIGEPDPNKNIFFKRRYKFLYNTFNTVPSLINQYHEKDGKYFFPTDAVMGIEGLPQSGTGQTSIFCGVNAQKIIGKHFGPYPYSTLLPIIKEKNIFAEFLKLNKQVSFANGYPKRFFEYTKKAKQRVSVTTHCCISSGVRLNTSTDVWKGRAVTAEINNFRWNQKLNYKLPVIKPSTAAKRLIKIALNNHFTLYEYFLTDYFGHGRIKDEMDYHLTVLDEFLFYILNNLPKSVTLLICSDHGNLEDVSVRTHTLNPTLTITAGNNAKYLSENISSLNDIKHAILGISN